MLTVPAEEPSRDVAVAYLHKRRTLPTLQIVQPLWHIPYTLPPQSLWRSRTLRPGLFGHGVGTHGGTRGKIEELSQRLGVLSAEVNRYVNRCEQQANHDGKYHDGLIVSILRSFLERCMLLLLSAEGLIVSVLRSFLVLIVSILRSFLERCRFA